MPKAYWISVYRSIKDPDKVAAYAKLAGPALAAGGARFLARGIPSVTYAHSDDRDQSFQRIATSVTWVRDGAVGCCF